MNGLQGIAARLAPIVEFLGALIAGIAAIIGQIDTGHPLNTVAILAAFVAAFGHATSHTTSTTAGRTPVP